MALALVHDNQPSLVGATYAVRSTVSFRNSGELLPDAIRRVFPGPKPDEQLAAAIGISPRGARSILAGQYPRSWTRFVRLIEKRPAILEHIIKADWTSKIALAREMSNVRSSVQRMEQALAASTKRAGLAANDGSEGPTVVGGASGAQVRRA